MVFSNQYEAVAQFLSEDAAVYVRGVALPEDSGEVKISVQDLVPLENARVDLPTLISIRVRLGANGSGASPAEELSDLFRRKPGAAEVRLRLEKAADFSVILDVPSRVRADKEFQAEVERICGPEALEILAQ
jgi:DNA polymerase-3 subunit alpha